MKDYSQKISDTFLTATTLSGCAAYTNRGLNKGGLLFTILYFPEVSLV